MLAKANDVAPAAHYNMKLALELEGIYVGVYWLRLHYLHPVIGDIVCTIVANYQAKSK